MSVAIATIVREFRYNGITLSDPAPDKSPDQVRLIYAFQYPELLNAVIEGPVTKNRVSTYTFTRAAGSKGASHLTSIRKIAQRATLDKGNPLDQAPPTQIEENQKCSKTVQAVVNNRAASAAILPGPQAYSHFG